MKSKIKIIGLLLFLGITSLRAQTLHYQGVARNAAGAPLANTSITLRLNIKDARENGNTLYTETKSVTTNSFGLYSISINDGTGTPTGDFTAIDWSQQRFIQTEMDPENGTVFTDLGTAPLHSVPQALSSATLNGIPQPREGYYVEYKNGEWIQKPKPKGQFFKGYGDDVVYSTSPKFVGPVYKFTVEEDHPVLTMSVTKVFGSSASNPNGANGGMGLHLGLGFQKTGSAQVTYFPEMDVLGIYNLSVPPNTRIPLTLSGRFITTFKKGEEYTIGMTAYNFSAPATWNNNGNGIGYVEISY